jgi:hypothetical protein
MRSGKLSPATRPHWGDGGVTDQIRLDLISSITNRGGWGAPHLNVYLTDILTNVTDTCNQVKLSSVVSGLAYCGNVSVPTVSYGVTILSLV